MEIKIININDLKPYEKNAKKHPTEQIRQVAASIEHFGWKQPLVIDRDNTIIIGHCRWLAAKQIGCDTVPCVIADDLSEAQIKALRLADNKTNESEWDLDLLNAELNGIFDIDMSDFGFEAYFEDESVPGEAKEDEFDIEANIPDEPISQLGDIYQLGRHRLMCGDSTSEASLNQLLAKNKADLYISDPPYNVDYEGKTKEKLKIQNDNMENEVFRSFLWKSFNNFKSHLKDGGCFYIFHADSEGYNFRGACGDAGLKVRQCLIWEKNTFVLGRQDYQWQHEPILYGWKDGASQVAQTAVLVLAEAVE